MTEPSIYFQDNRERGSLVVLAFSEEEAREIMSSETNYDPNEPVRSHDIFKMGLVMVSYTCGHG